VRTWNAFTINDGAQSSMSLSALLRTLSERCRLSGVSQASVPEVSRGGDRQHFWLLVSFAENGNVTHSKPLVI